MSDDKARGLAADAGSPSPLVEALALLRDVREAIAHRPPTWAEAWALLERLDKMLGPPAAAEAEQLAEIKRGGLLTRRQHEAALASETARLRERLRRATEERLTPKAVVLEHLAADPKDGERKLRAALALQRSSFRALIAEHASLVRDPGSLRMFAEKCLAEIDATLAEVQS